MKIPAKNLDNSIHYNHPNYQDTVRIERGCRMGLSEEEIYQLETDFSLQTANIDLQNGDRLLDLASGVGKHMACMDKHFNGKVQMDGVEKAEELAKYANTNVLAEVQHGNRSNLRVHIGNMLDLQRALPKSPAKSEFKLITCLGFSFINFNKKQRNKILEDVFSLLLKGGKVVIQWREAIPGELEHWKKTCTQKNTKGPFVLLDQKRNDRDIVLHVDSNKGDGFYFYPVDCPHPDIDNAQDYESYISESSGCIEYREKDENKEGNYGAMYKTWGRVYDPDINTKDDSVKREIDLNTTTTNRWLWSTRKAAVQYELEKMGFTQVEFHQSERTGNIHRLHSMVAMKPWV
jgi:SAM-dependent methyltransferase